MAAIRAAHAVAPKSGRLEAPRTPANPRRSAPPDARRRAIELGRAASLAPCVLHEGELAPRLHKHFGHADLPTPHEPNARDGVPRSALQVSLANEPANDRLKVEIRAIFIQRNR